MSQDLKTVIVLCCLLGGCGDRGSFDAKEPDQCMRREIFKECMASLPKGPQTTVTNDWDEVVGACENAAYYQSLRRRSQIKVECRP